MDHLPLTDKEVTFKGATTWFKIIGITIPIVIFYSNIHWTILLLIYSFTLAFLYFILEFSNLIEKY